MKIAIVLGSGGARGWAHIGVIEELEARGHEVVTVAGASIGALVGGIYAAGKLPELKDWTLGLSKSDVRSLLDFTLGRPGLLKGTRVLKAIEEVTGSHNIEDLKIPFTAIAADILTGREVWFQKGPLYLAIRASIAIPTFFTPVRIGNRLLVDGGLLNPVPIEPTLSIEADATIAVDLRGPALTNPHEILRRDDSEADNSQSWIGRAAASAHEGLATIGEGWERTKRSFLETEFFQRLESEWSNDPDDENNEEAAGEAIENTDSTSNSPDANPTGAAASSVHASPLPESLTTMEVLSLSLDAMQNTLARYRAAPNPVAATVRIPSDAVGDLDYHRARELIDLGRNRAIDAFDDAGL
ncbi:NTE family protein [Trueperella bonasi]|uniref:NTE family protein n=1 Tax=Trueperella bonasi TaxID=312286 RepID=A0ABT9NF89_9ACTO|nr:patatin-like phospholipase family protein [Trueperella bonasi]MDP9806059.1 NTE family protein [Trueperella bonasi]